MTECEKLGYKVGDKFIMNETANGFKKGQEVELYIDDGSDCPLFKGDNDEYTICGGQPGAYLELRRITKITDREVKLGDKIIITDFNGSCIGENYTTPTLVTVLTVFEGAPRSAKFPDGDWWFTSQFNWEFTNDAFEEAQQYANKVNHPPHYNQGDIECIDAIHSALGDEGFIAFCRGNAMKYTWRAGLKGDRQKCLSKAQWYLNKIDEILENR